MSKKLITACLALFALAAFALPASATAAPEVTHPTGTTMSTRSTTCTTVGEAGCIKATNVGETLLKDGSGVNTLARCTTAIMTGTLTKNNGTEIEADIQTATFSGTGAAFAGMNECTGTFGNLTVTTNGTHEGVKIDEGTVTNGTPYCLKANNKMAADEFQIRGGTCSEAARKITFIFDTTVGAGSTECKYERAEVIKGTFSTHPEDAVLSVAAGANTKFTGEAGNNILCPTSGTLQMSFTLETDASGTVPIYIS